jgi:hypothetical protein
VVSATAERASVPAGPGPGDAGDPGSSAGERRRARAARAAPTLVAALLAAAYVIVSPPSRDLAGHLFRAALLKQEGFGIWNDYWYGGHHILGYSVLFPAVSAALTPQLAAALAATATAALFEPLARRHFGPDAWLGALLFGAATAIDLYTGRLALAFGALPALGAIVALDRGATVPAAGLALLAALCSPVAALFAALAAAAHALAHAATGRRGTRGVRRAALAAAVPGLAVAAAALVPIGVLAIAFPEGGTEPFGLATLLPVLAICAGALIAIPMVTLRAGVAVYGLATIAAYAAPSPVGSNIARLGTLLAAPLAALLWWRRRTVLLAILALPLLYVGWQAPVSDVAAVTGDASTSAAYYQPLLAFLGTQPGGRTRAFRIEIPFTASHWEAYRVALRFPLARGWERQLDRKRNPIFYGDRLTAASYKAWLDANAVRYVAVPDVAPDDSARAERALIDHRPPYLRLVMRSAHWRLYAVTHPTPIATGAATLTAMGPDWLTLSAHGAGAVIVRVHFTPYWALARGSGCVSPDGADTRLILRHGGPVRLVIRFSPERIGARGPRCT